MEVTTSAGVDDFAVPSIMIMIDFEVFKLIGNCFCVCIYATVVEKEEEGNTKKVAAIN